jgi:hypothetical protein
LNSLRRRKPGMVVHAFNHSYLGGIDRRIEASQGKVSYILDPISKPKPKQPESYLSACRGHGFNFQYQQNKTRKKNLRQDREEEEKEKQANGRRNGIYYK